MGNETKQRPLILVTNDDGIKAGGLVALVSVLKEFGDVVVVAPNQSYSGMSHAITVKVPLYSKLVKDKDGLKLYKINGTPVDCIKLGINKLLSNKPDLVVSGINHGSNSSISIHYSGTMGAAREGALSGIPSVGFSLLDYHYEADFEPALPYVRHVVKLLLEQSFEAGVYFNVNIPKGNQLKGLKVGRQSHGKWVESFIERQDPRGRDYYWLTGHFENFEPTATDTDEYALANGYVSMVPCTLDATNHQLLTDLKKYEL